MAAPDRDQPEYWLQWIEQNLTTPTFESWKTYPEARDVIKCCSGMFGYKVAERGCVLAKKYYDYQEAQKSGTVGKQEYEMLSILKQRLELNQKEGVPESELIIEGRAVMNAINREDRMMYGRVGM